MRAYRFWTKKDLLTAREQLAAGIPLDQVAADLGRTPVSVRRALQENGMHQPRRSPELWKKILQPLWQRGYSAGEIAQRLGVPVSTVKRQLQRLGWQNRPCDRRRSHRKCLKTLGGPSLADERWWRWREKAIGAGFPGARSPAELDTLMLLREHGALSCRDLARRRGVAEGTQYRTLRLLAERALLVKAGVSGPLVRWSLPADGSEERRETRCPGG